MRKGIFVWIGILMMCVAHGHAQSDDDFGIWTSIGVKKALVSNLNGEVEAEFRTRDGFGDVDRWTLSAGLDYKIFSFLKVDAGYKYIRNHHENETTQKGNYIPAYWQNKHRVYLSLTGKVRWDRLEFSLRERYQYTHRAALSVPKYDDEGFRVSDEEITGKGKHVLRSRVQVEWNIRRSSFTPYVSCELFNSLSDDWEYEKTRLTVGTQYKINKRNAFNVFYLYQDESDEDEASGHAIGIGYTYRF